MNISENDMQYLIQTVNKRSMFKTQYDIEFIHSKLKDFNFFKNMNREIGDLQYYKILKELQYECPNPYESLVNIGDQCSKFYFILSGRFLILTNNSIATIQLPTEISKNLDKLFPNLIPQGYLQTGQYFGEQVMMFDQQHTQTILPLEKSHLLVIKRETYRRIIDQEIKKREQERFSNLSSIPLFQKWSAKTVKVLSCEIQELNFIPNQIIYYQGDPVDSVYIIIDGQIQLFRATNKNQIPFSILGCKESFGDDEILTQFRSHSAKSLTSVKLYKIKKKQFLDLIPFDYSNKDFQKSQHLKFNFNQNEDYTRMYRSESLKAIRSPAKLLQRIMRKSQDKNKTYQSISFQQVQDPIRKDIRYSNTPTVLQKTNSIHEQTRIHANVKFDKTTFLLNQIKLRSTNFWKKTK